MKSILTLCLVLFASTLFAQNATITGTVVDNNQNPVENYLVTLSPTSKSTLTNSSGVFLFNEVAPGTYVLQYGANNKNQLQVTVTEGENLTLQGFVVTSSQVAPEQEEVAPEIEGNIFTDLNALEGDDESSSVSSLLTASRDVFLNKAGFQFGSDVFFKVRGYDSRYSDFMVNGVRFENPETGWQPFSIVGGMNDVLRYRDIETIGLSAQENGFGEIGGSRDYQLRPSEYGHGGRFTYSNLNRYYNNRLMGFYASGDKGDGVSYVVSASKRWAQEGYVDGTYYDAYGAFAAAEKKITDNYSVALTAFAAPRRRGTNSIHRQEAYDIVGSNYYNADWGWQDGRKRNARLRKNLNPVVQLSNYINLSPNTDLQLTGSYLFGDYVTTRLERQNAGNPDPDYYQNLPSFAGDTAPFISNQQLDWISFYRANMTETPSEADEYEGNRANYILEENHRDDKDLQAIAHFNTKLNDNTRLFYGANFRHYNGNFYKEINDLLGADYFLDIDTFNDNLANNADAADPRVGLNQRFGWDYDLNKRSYDAFVQGNIELSQWDLFANVMIGQSNYWREGNFSSGAFPDVSKGKGEVKNFMQYGAKAGATYKLDGRNYFSANGMFYQRPPELRTVWAYPLTRDNFNPLTEEEQVYGGEINYNHKSPFLTLRATGYATRFDNQAESLLGFSATGVENTLADDIDSNFGFFYTNNIDKLHYGGELGVDYKLTTDISLSGAAAIGKYTYMSRPLVTGYIANEVNPSLPENSSFLLDFYEPNTPQTAFNLGVTYRAPSRFIINVDANYYDNSYASPSAIRRIIPVAKQFVPVDGLSEEETLSYWTKQEKLPTAFRTNISLYKEFRFSYSKRLGVNASVNNIFDDQNYPSLAFEDIRVQNNGRGIDPSEFPTRYLYSPGRTYFINIAYKFM